MTVSACINLSRNHCGKIECKGYAHKSLIHVRELKCNEIVTLAYSTSTNEVKLNKNTQGPDTFINNMQDKQK